MNNIRIDADGTPRCWNCGSKALTEKRTFRSKAAVGVGALLTKKKLKCQRCGEYNDTGNGKPWTGPAARKYRKEWQAEQQQRAVETVPAVSPADEIVKLAELHRAGALTDEEFAAAKARLL